jgi:hypothetical protein
MGLALGPQFSFLKFSVRALGSSGVALQIGACAD